MKFKITILITGLMLTSGLAACMRAGGDVSPPEPSTLGAEYAAYQPPARPDEAAGSDEIAGKAGTCTEGDITIERAMALALMYNPGLRAYSWNVRSIEARRLDASMRPNPELEFEADEVGGQGSRRGFDAAELTVSLNQLVELGGKRGKRIKLASAEKEMARWGYEAVRLEVFAEVSTAFTDLVAAQQRVELAEEMLEISGKLLQAVERRVEAGKDAPLEKAKAGVEQSRMKIEYQRSVKQLDLARRRLASTWGGSAPGFDRAEGKLEEIVPVPPLESLNLLIDRNPDLLMQSLNTEVKAAALDLERSMAIPDVTLSGGMKRFNEIDENMFLFGISIPLQLWNRNQAGKMMAAYDLKGAEEEEKETGSRIYIELATAWNDLSSSYAEAVELRDNVLRAAGDVFEASRRSYAEGKLDYLNLLDAQRTLYEAKMQYIGALAAYHAAKAEVERLTGREIDNEL